MVRGSKYWTFMNIGLVRFRRYPLISPDITLFQWSAPLHTIHSCRHSFWHTTWKYYYEIVSDILSDWYSFWHLYLPYLLTCLLSSGILSGISSEISLWSRSLTGHLNGPGHVKRRGSFTTSSPRLEVKLVNVSSQKPSEPSGPGVHDGVDPLPEFDEFTGPMGPLPSVARQESWPKQKRRCATATFGNHEADILDLNGFDDLLSLNLRTVIKTCCND